METYSFYLMIASLCGLAALGLALAAKSLSDFVLDKWRHSRPCLKWGFLAAALLAALYGGTKQATVSYPKTESGTAYLTDNGSSVTNDAVTLNFTRPSLVPDDAWLYLDCYPMSITNAADVAANCVTVYSNQFSDIELPLTIPYENATNFNWIAYTDWTPGPVVHTNGVVNVAWLKAKGEMPPNAVRVVPLRTEVNPIPVRPYLSYVQDGLVALFDGEWNTPDGHDPTATTWQSLVGDNALTLTGATWADGLALDTGVGGAINGTRVVAARTLEICANIRTHPATAGSYASIVCNGPLNAAAQSSRQYLSLMAWNVKGTQTLQAQYATFYPIADFGKAGPRTYATAFNFAAFDGIVSTNAVTYTDGRGANTGYLSIGSRAANIVDTKGKFYSVRIYDRELTPDEIAHNYEIDKRRFGSGLGATE